MKKRIIAVVIACVLSAGAVGLIATKSAQKNELQAFAQIEPIEEAALEEEEEAALEEESADADADADAGSAELTEDADVLVMYAGDSLLADSEPEGPKPKLDAIDPDAIAEVPEELKKVHED